MQKTIKADNKEIVLKTNGLTPLIYQRELKRDFFKDAIAIANKKYDAIVISDMLWCFAFTADDSLPPIEKWLSEFDCFPLLDFIPVVVELLTSALTIKATEKVSEEKTVKKKKIFYVLSNMFCLSKE